MTTGKFRFSTFLLYAVAILILIVQIYPVIWLILSSLKSSIELTSRPFSLPSTWLFDNYSSVIRESHIFLYIKNTAIVTFSCIILIVLLSSSIGFALEKMQFKINAKLLAFFTIGIMIPVQVTLIP